LTVEVQDETNLVSSAVMTVDVLDVPEEPYLPTITIGDVAQPEGDAGRTGFSLLVSLSHPSEERVTVQYATKAGTATEGRFGKWKANEQAEDYYRAVGRVVFQPGETLAMVEVQVNADHRFEQDETFYVNLTNANGAGKPRNDPE
jgi:hypothetical protein